MGQEICVCLIGRRTETTTQRPGFGGRCVCSPVLLCASATRSLELVTTRGDDFHALHGDEFQAHREPDGPRRPSSPP
jgi:hypothetical protein